LTSAHENVSGTIYRESIYAVDVQACLPAFDDPDEHFLPGDRLLIETDPRRWLGNLQALHNRLCVTVFANAESSFVTIRRLKVGYSEGTKSRSLMACGDENMVEWLKEKEKMRQDLEKYGKHLRWIDFRSTDELSVKEGLFQEIDVSAVVGKAVRLIRDL
jgi:hypothetical protein